MINKQVSSKNQQEKKSVRKAPEIISYRMKCPKTANGLSHFVMYGDIKEEETLL